MKNKLNLSLYGSEDFDMLCSIFQINPETLLQLFIDRLSFPLFYSHPDGKERWATLFFINFLEYEDASYHVDPELQDKYLTKFNRATAYIPNGKTQDFATKVKAGRAIMMEWQKAVLSARASYLTDNL